MTPWGCSLHGGGLSMNCMSLRALFALIHYFFHVKVSSSSFMWSSALSGWLRKCWASHERGAAYPHVALEPNDKGCKYWMTPARHPKHSFFVNHFRESWISHGSAGLDRLVPKPGCWEKAFRQISWTNSNLYRKWIWCSLMHQFAQDCAGTYVVRTWAI